MNRRLNIALAALILAAAAQAQPRDVAVDAQLCWGGSSHLITAASGAVMGTYQLTGPMRSTEPGGAFDGAGFECVGTFESISGDYRQVGYCIAVDKQGDKAWGRDIRNKSEDTYEYLGGTGKYAGISGTLRKERPGTFAAPRAGSTQGCSRLIGSYRVQ